MKSLLTILCFSLIFPSQSQAYQFGAYGTSAQSCYAKAMVGMDSVINARAGVPPEHTLRLSLKSGTPSEENSTYFTNTLIIMLDAYLWEDTPHNYAINVFFNCAAGTNPTLKQANFQ